MYMSIGNTGLSFRRIATIISVYCMIAGISPAHAAQETLTSADRPDKTSRTTLHADISGQVNPEGLMLLFGGYHRWIRDMNNELNMPSSYLQAGATAGISPAYGKVAAHAEWMPAIFAKVRFEYDWYRFFGANGALLSFPSRDSKFGRNEVDALKGREETVNGERFLIRPTFYGKIGPVIISNRTDFAYYRLTGRGPYFLEWEYEILLKRRDHVFNNRTDFLKNVWKGSGEASLLTGPYYELTHASGADLTRQRVGGVVFWIPQDTLWSFNRPRVYSQFGIYLQDPNRQGEPYFAIGAGFDFDL